MKRQKSPAASDGFEQLIPLFSFLFQLGINILQTAAGFFLFRIRHGNAMNRADIKDAGFFRFRF